jgi:hypothetical protein
MREWMRIDPCCFHCCGRQVRVPISTQVETNFILYLTWKLFTDEFEVMLTINVLSRAIFCNLLLQAYTQLEYHVIKRDHLGSCLVASIWVKIVCRIHSFLTVLIEYKSPAALGFPDYTKMFFLKAKDQWFVSHVGGNSHSLTRREDSPE